MLSPDALARLARYLGSVLNEARGVALANVALLHGGVSRDTYSFDALYDGVRGPVKRGFIARMDAKGRIWDAERALEYACYRAVQGRGVPAPMPIALVEDTSILGAPFLLVERIENAFAASPFRPEPYGIYAGAIGRNFFSILGKLAAIDPYATELAQIMTVPQPEKCWSRELDYWENVLNIDAVEPQPIALAAIRRLRKNPPPPPKQVAIVHGDFRHGNFLHDGAGHITALLDWDLAHIGDPLEDLAWSTDPIWSLGRAELAAGLMPRHEAVRLWEENSGLSFDPERFRWWSLFCGVKGLAIWAAAARSYNDKRSSDPMRAFTGWYCATRHNQIIADRLAAAPRGGF